MYIFRETASPKEKKNMSENFQWFRNSKGASVSGVEE